MKLILQILRSTSKILINGSFISKFTICYDNNMNNNKNENKTTTLKTLLMLSIISMMLIPRGIIPVHIALGNILFEINNPLQYSGDALL